MLKLIIADDERVIRESISTLIDWNSIGIELIGTCRDGIEAYNMIIDESPDIVLTDIQMTGMSGLELIERIYNTDLNTIFVILTGYDKFEYAKTAMRYKVRHFLLKPCNEESIIESMQEVINDYYKNQASRDLQEHQKELTANLYYSILSNIINEQIFVNDKTVSILDMYTGFIDFYNIPYELCFLHYIEEEEEEYISILNNIYKAFENFAPNIFVYSIYVKNTLIIFFEGFKTDYLELDDYMNSLSAKFLYKRESLKNLDMLLEVLISKIRRYGIIYFMNGTQPIPTCNFNNLISEIEELTSLIISSDEDKIECYLKDLISIINDIDSPHFLKQSGSRILIKLSTESNYISSLDTTEYLMDINQQYEVETIRKMLIDTLTNIIKNSTIHSQQYSSLVLKTMEYVEKHLSDSNLTLKYIADNYLYMNVDYVSKRFVKETKQKFSNYLTSLRIQKAKQLLTDKNIEQIQLVAQQVGCGNNPQYFSQIFKKNTGMTPSAYIKKITESNL